MTKHKCNQIFNNGSTWIKADFHLHTRADKEFIYDKSCSEFPPENTFPNDFVNKLKETNINLGVITNHNKFDYKEFNCLRKKALKEDIYLLPGVELSVNDGANGIHTLIVFADSWINGNDYINPFLSIMFPGKATSEYQNENGRSDKNILHVVDELEKTNRDYFIIFAHVEQKSGLFFEMSGGKLSDFAENRYALVRKRTLAFQKVRTVELREKNKKLFKSWYPAEVEGSDCKCINDIDNKKGDCWIKIGDFSFEAVKYSLKDFQNRVSNTVPDGFKHSHIVDISFVGGTLDGHKILFSPELNTLIGIRGSGKSSILETLRYVLDIPLGEKANDSSYKNSLIEHTFGSGGKAIVTAVDRHGTTFNIKRILNENPEVYIDGKFSSGISIRDTIIRNPLYFGQKDLSLSGEGFEKDLVEKLVGDKLYEKRKQILEQKKIVKDLISKINKSSNIDEDIEEQNNIIRDSMFRLNKFIEYGIEKALKKQTDFEDDKRHLTKIINDVDKFNESFNILITNNEEKLKGNLKYESSQNKVFFEEVYKIYSEIISALDDFKRYSITASEILNQIKDKDKIFNTDKMKFIDEFAEIRRKVEVELKNKGVESINVEEFPQIKEKIVSAKKELQKFEKQKKQKKIFDSELAQEISKLNQLWNEEFLIIKRLLNKINSNNSSLKIESKYKGDKEDFLDFFRSKFKGSKLRETTFAKLVESYTDFWEIFQNMDKVKQNISSADIFEEYLMNNLKDFLTYQIQNKFTIYYHDKELKYHSLGQRSSALIIFILNHQDNDLIIVDQPEDDLDNQTIYEDVIKLIKEIKPNMQFIFATHNANFPVLGDSEQIISCQYSDEKIETISGSIDSPLLQKEIIEIMEGGKDAFKKRKEIYEIWEPNSVCK